MTWCRDCKAEWQRQYRAGVVKQKRVPPPVRVGECLLWQGCVDSNGYGRVTLDEASRYVHVVAFETTHGPMPDDEQDDWTVDHMCEVKHCVEPSHLQLVPRGENTRLYYERRRAELSLR